MKTVLLTGAPTANAIRAFRENLVGRASPATSCNPEASDCRLPNVVAWRLIEMECVKARGVAMRPYREPDPCVCQTSERHATVTHRTDAIYE
jgi:hypothetical protein